MSFFSKLWQAFQIMPRAHFCAHLQSLGIDAQMAPRGRAEENSFGHPILSTGVIDIVEGPIRWVNVTRATRDAPDEGNSTRHLVYGVPDPKVRSEFPEVRLYAIPVRENEGFWPRGRVIGVRWDGEDFGLGIVEHLNQNVIVPTAFLESLRVDSFEIWPYPDLGCWILTVEDVLRPSKQEWECYQSIASHLLETPLPPKT